jgi:hypothetical protein
MNKVVLRTILVGTMVFFLASCSQNEESNFGVGDIKDELNNSNDENTNNESELGFVDVDTSEMSDEEFAKFQASRFIDTVNSYASETEDDDIKEITEAVAEEIASKGGQVSYSKGVFTSEFGIKFSIVFEKDKAILGEIIK